MIDMFMLAIGSLCIALSLEKTIGFSNSMLLAVGIIIIIVVLKEKFK